MNKRIIFLLLVCTMSLSSIATTIKETLLPCDVIAKQIGAGPAEIVMFADSIAVNLTVWENDTLPPKILTPNLCFVIQYTLCQPIMYFTDKRVYSAFYADAQLVIYKGQSYLTLELDYNIDKWRLLDENGTQLCRHDLKNSELLSLIHAVYPESRNINIKYERFIN